MEQRQRTGHNYALVPQDTELGQGTVDRFAIIDQGGMAGVKWWWQLVGLNVLSSDLDQLARFACPLGLGYHIVRSCRLRRPNDDRRFAIMELLNNALTE